MGESAIHLIDCFMPLAAYVVLFHNTVAKRQPEYQQVKTDVQRLLSRAEQLRKEGELPPEEFDQARFAVCAWVDEAILNSPWSQKGLWQKEQLQRLYYNTFDSGVELFDRLNNLGLHQKGVREVYYLCLALGFKGRFIHQGDDLLLEQLKSSNLKLLAGASGAVPLLSRLELFPEAYPASGVAVAQPPARFRLNLVTGLALAGPVVLYGVLYLIYRFTLSGVAGKIF